ncbi:ABC transporter substrate-binding protein [Variovorax sp. GB1P17]
MTRAAPRDNENAGDILIGQSAPLSGLMAEVAGANRRGEAAAIEDLNARGGINGRKIKVLQLDDAFEAQAALANTRQLVEKDKVVALWAYTGTSAVAAVLPYVESAKVPLIAVYTGSPALRAKKNPYFFTASASYADELVAIVRTMVTMQAKRIAVVYQDNPFGNLLLPLANKIAQEEGATVLDAHPLQVDGNNADEVSKAVGQTQPSTVLLIAAGPAVLAYAKAHRRLRGAWLCVMSLGVASSTVKALGEDARGLAAARTTPFPGRQTTPLMRDFHASMAKRGLPADYDHLIGYMYARVLIEALRLASPRLSSESIARSLERASRLDLGGFELNFGPAQHHGSNFVEITMIGSGGRILR